MTSHRLPASEAAPTLNAAVHYVSEGSPILPDGSQKYISKCIAADVTELDPDDPTRVGLFVKNPTGVFFRPLGLDGSVFGRDGGQWHHLH